MEYKLTSKIDRVGRLLLPAQYKDFCNSHKNERVIVTIETLPDEPSAALRTYYVRYILPAVQSAFKANGEYKTIKQIDEFLRIESPICKRSAVAANGKIVDYLIEFEELTAEQLMEHIEFLKIYCAENFDMFINDPATI